MTDVDEIRVATGFRCLEGSQWKYQYQYQSRVCYCLRDPSWNVLAQGEEVYALSLVPD
jgi:hypothetical protein